ncbi:MAG: cupin domain-containing protein [Chloroflexi bacterium]|nr:cupin domain-containing protein [Chloroflexota bacterium]
MQVEQLLVFEESGSKRTAVNEITLSPGTHLSLTAHPQERLFYFLDGRGIISIYEKAPAGDVYELRQDISVYMTPGIQHELFNIGNTPLRYVEFLIQGGTVPDGDLSWSAITQRGVTVDKPVAGSGVAVTRVFDEGHNPSKEEGLHLRIRDIWLRRPQKLANAEVLTIAPGCATRPHTHFDTGETSYVLYGQGKFIWDDREIPCTAGSTISYPIGVQRQVVNTGQFPMSCIVIASFLD